MKRSSPRKAPLLTLRHALAAQARHSGIYLKALAKWLFCALLTGGVCGLLGTAFHYSIRYATGLRFARKLFHIGQINTGFLSDG